MKDNKNILEILKIEDNVHSSNQALLLEKNVNNENHIKNAVSE